MAEDPVWKASDATTEPSKKIQDAANKMTKAAQDAEKKALESKDPDDSTQANREAHAAISAAQKNHKHG